MQEKVQERLTVLRQELFKVNNASMQIQGAIRELENLLKEEQSNG